MSTNTIRIAMFTNTYLPMVGGVSLSIKRFADELRANGHEVLIVAPEFDGQPQHEDCVVRIAALKDFNETQFSLPLPFHLDLGSTVEEFEPDIIHVHHPFFLGDTGLRVAAQLGTPVVATNHTQYEDFTHYIPAEAEWMKPFVQQLAVGHANLCDAVVAPSTSVRDKLIHLGVWSPVHVIPTGVDLAALGQGKGESARKRFSIPDKTPLMGHVGRLAQEKNLEFLARAAARALDAEPNRHFLVVGDGPQEDAMRGILEDWNVNDRVRFAGVLQGQELVDAYAAFDVFVFASQSETQGMVLAEACAAGAPVVALEGSGVLDVVENHENGCLLPEADEVRFAEAVQWVEENRKTLSKRARRIARQFGIERCTQRIVRLYEQVLRSERSPRDLESSEWARLLRTLQAEWDIWTKRVGALRSVFAESHEDNASG